MRMINQDRFRDLYLRMKASGQNGLQEKNGESSEDKDVKKVFR